MHLHITGASKPGQARANARVSSLSPLSPSLHQELFVYRAKSRVIFG
jgi:hypothetical protein